jgi:dihydrofolate synthase/folylpolyglutamate synthase
MIVRRNKPRLIFDVGHNRAGVAAFVETFKILFPDKKAHIITGFVKRKEHQKMFDSLSEITAQYALVPLATKRTTEISELIRTIDWRERPLRRFGSLTSAYNWVRNRTDRDDIIVVIGSHYLVGEFFEKFGIK